MLNAEELWGKACQILKSEIPTVSYNSWIEAGLKAHALVGDTLLLECQSPVILAVLMQRYMDGIQRAVNASTDTPTKVEILCDDKMEERVKELEARFSGDPLALLNPKYTFDSFVVGDSNRFAHAVSLAVAEMPAKIIENSPSSISMSDPFKMLRDMLRIRFLPFRFRVT